MIDSSLLCSEVPDDVPRRRHGPYAYYYLYFVFSAVLGELYTEAAECATAAMKGRLASKYFALAEEAWTQVEG